MHVVSHVPKSLSDNQTGATHATWILYGKKKIKLKITLISTRICYRSILSNVLMNSGKCITGKRLNLVQCASQPVLEEMNVYNFGRIIAYLPFVYRLGYSCDEETIQEAVRRTVEAFRLIDLKKYKVKPSWFNFKHTA